MNEYILAFLKGITGKQNHSNNNKNSDSLFVIHITTSEVIHITISEEDLGKEKLNEPQRNKVGRHKFLAADEVCKTIFAHSALKRRGWGLRSLSALDSSISASLVLHHGNTDERRFALISCVSSFLSKGFTVFPIFVSIFRLNKLFTSLGPGILKRLRNKN